MIGQCTETGLEGGTSCREREREKNRETEKQRERVKESVKEWNDCQHVYD